MSFVKRLMRGLSDKSAPASRTTHTTSQPPRQEFRRTKFDSTPHLRHAVLRTGLTKGRESDFAFYLAALRANELNYRDIRKRGTALTKEEKTAAGINFRGIVTAEFLDTLNEVGLADPMDAAQKLGQSASHYCYQAASLAHSTDMGHTVELVPSNLAAGPCPRASRLAGKPVHSDAAPITPFDDCTHPDQCACFYKTHYRG